MSKQITSPVKRFSGTVTLSDPLTLEQCIEWERATREASTLREQGQAGEATEAEYLRSWLPGIRAAVETWNLAGLDPDKWPGTPRADVANLLAWLIGEVTALYMGEGDVPNG